MGKTMELQEMVTVLYRYKRLYERRCGDIMQKYDLRLADLDILYYLAHSGSRNMAKDIVDTGMSKANVSKTVEHLRQKGLIALSEDREDRRCTHLQIRQEAEPIVLQIELLRRELWEALTCGIGEGDRECVSRVMHRIGENINGEWMKALEKEAAYGEKQ